MDIHVCLLPRGMDPCLFRIWSAKSEAVDARTGSGVVESEITSERRDPNLCSGFMDIASI